MVELQDWQYPPLPDPVEVWVEEDDLYYDDPYVDFDCGCCGCCGCTCYDDDDADYPYDDEDEN